MFVFFFLYMVIYVSPYYKDNRFMEKNGGTDYYPPLHNLIGI